MKQFTYIVRHDPEIDGWRVERATGTHTDTVNFFPEAMESLGETICDDFDYDGNFPPGLLLTVTAVA